METEKGREGETEMEKIETGTGRRTYRMRRVKSIVHDSDVRLPRDVIPPAVLHFYNIDPRSREILNAEALYTLAGKHDGAGGKMRNRFQKLRRRRNGAGGARLLGSWDGDVVKK